MNRGMRSGQWVDAVDGKAVRGSCKMGSTEEVEVNGGGDEKGEGCGQEESG